MVCGLEVNLSFIEATVDQDLAQDIGDGRRRRQQTRHQCGFPCCRTQSSHAQKGVDLKHRGRMVTKGLGRSDQCHQEVDSVSKVEREGRRQIVGVGIT